MRRLLLAAVLSLIAAASAWALAQIDTNIPTVGTNTDLLARAETFPFIYRGGYAAAGDGGQMLYRHSGSACTLGSGAGDNGLQVRASDGGCYIAQLDPQGAPLTLWGIPGGTDDTAILEAADAAANSAAWPAGVAKTIFFPAATVALNTPNLVTSNLKLVFARGTVVAGARDVTPNSQVINYQGKGPFEIDFNGGKIICTTYAAVGLLSEPGGCGNDAIKIRSPSDTAQITGVYIRNAYIVGGNNQITVANSQQVYVQADQLEMAYGFGVVVTQQTNGLGVTTDNVDVEVTNCLMIGQYCVSTPVDGPDTNLTTARDVTVNIKSGVGNGWQDAKGCADITSEVGERLNFNITCSNSNFGVETKNTGELPNTYPDAFRDRVGTLVMHQEIDNPGYCLQIPFENSRPTTANNRQINGTFTASCFADLSAVRRAGAYYPVGAAFHTAAGRIYQIIKEGMTDAGTGPTGASAYKTGYADGTAIVIYLGPQPSTTDVDGEPIPKFQNFSGVEIEANTNLAVDLVAQDVAYGYVIMPRGSDDNTIRYLYMKLRGRVNAGCLTDTYSVLFAHQPVVDHAYLDNWQCLNIASGVGAQAALSLGNGHGHGNFINWTNIAISGGTLTGANMGIRNNGGSVRGMMTGASVSGNISAIYAEGETFLNVIGGSLATRGPAGKTEGVITGERGASGNITLLPSAAIFNSDRGKAGAFLAAGGTLAVIGQGFNPPASGLPTAHCTPGVDVQYESGAASHKYACTAAPNKWTQMY
jgi:hypothetical protein